MNSSARRVPSVGSFPEPLKEPEMIDLDNFAFDQESLNESIHEMAFTFGTDEEYQPNAQNKHEDRKMSLKVVSVTETQVIDREEGLRVAEQPSPTYATVMKPKAKAKEDIVDVTQVIDREEGLRVAEQPSPTYATVMKPKAKAKEDIVDVTQVIDREEGLRVAEQPSPTYATVMKPKAKATEDIVDVTL